MIPEKIIRINDYLCEIPRDSSKGMLVPARIYADEKILREMDSAVIEQITNVAMLPGIQKYAICLPDGHSGYGFPIGGVAAIDPAKGVISPGGIGFDINCGIRLIATSLTIDEVRPKIEELVSRLFSSVPAGVGAEGIINLKSGMFDEAMTQGAEWALKNGFAEREDIECTEDRGRAGNANPESVSQKARERGKNQIGTLGSGNHFLEIQSAMDENIFDSGIARTFGITGRGQIFIMIHCGSRAFGHQIATDYLQRFLSAMPKFGISMPDRELACAPYNSEEGMSYFEAMNCAINIAFLNRQIITHRVREVFSDVFKKSPNDLGMRLVYDVCHNTAKLEKHMINGREKELLVHRKGATRAFPPGAVGLPEKYRASGQPVIIGGSMETGSYILSGVQSSEDAFFTTAHGSGRVMSRREAKRRYNGRDLLKKLNERGIYIQTASLSGLAEEAGGAYKDIDEVVRATEGAGLSKPVAKLVPLGNIKG
jgi:tRNA-splicing ligase RtcB